MLVLWFGRICVGWALGWVVLGLVLWVGVGLLAVLGFGVVRCLGGGWFGFGVGVFGCEVGCLGFFVSRWGWYNMPFGWGLLGALDCFVVFWGGSGFLGLVGCVLTFGFCFWGFVVGPGVCVLFCGFGVWIVIV